METKEQKPSEIFDWLSVEVSAIDCMYRGDPSYEHDAYWMRDAVQRLIEHARKAFPDPNETPALSVQKQLVEALEAAEKAMGRILPYLIWTIGEESPGHHPTLPSAVGAFKYSLNEEVRAAILAAKASS